MKFKRLLLTALAAVMLSSAAYAQTPAPPASAPGTDMQDVIKGTMKIDFQSRKYLDTTGSLKAGSAAVGALDIYTTDLTVANVINFNGVVKRQPNLYKKGSWFADLHVHEAVVQDGQLYYDLNVAVNRPTDKAITLGKWVGIVPVNTTTGAFDIAGGSVGNSPLRFDIDTVGQVQAFRENFKGTLWGKSEVKDSLKQKVWKHVNPDGKVTSIVIKKNDPLRFENLVVARGPTPNSAAFTVNGEMNYDYEKGNYFLDNLRFSYRDPKTGTDTVDVLSGTIKWVKNAQYETNGKSSYQFNLVWNAPAPTGDETAVVAGADDESAVFTEVPGSHHLSGTIDYTDTRVGTGDNATVTDSAVEYHLDSHGLRRDQVMMFFKTWMLGIGPENDE